MLIINPSMTSNYYIRAEGLCNTTTCVSNTITVNSLSSPGNFITASSDSICQGSSVTLNLSGGIPGTYANWYWYAGSFGGTALKSGLTLAATPATTTNYYIRAEGICNTTTCISVTVTVNLLSLPAVSVTASSDFICLGSSITLNVNGGILGTSANWYWDSGSCGGTASGSGLTFVCAPSATTNYYVMAEGICNSTVCSSKLITVNSLSLLQFR